MRYVVLVCALLFVWSLCASASEPVSPPGTSEPPESAPSTSESLPQSSNPQMILPPELLEKWNEYNKQFGDFTLTLEQFLDQVEAFGISFEELPNFIQLLIDSYRDSEDKRIAERKAAAEAIDAALKQAARAEKAGRLWKYGTIGGAVLAVAGWGAFGVLAMIR